ncbi:MAG: PP0621 family protein [Gammaproteobacteria bacterium]|nr:PP0621 family protein [Gammaproteobacteria bacterium]
MRILVLIVIGLLLYIIISNLFRKKSSSQQQEELGKMVRCKHCDLHILEQEAVQSEGNYYCSQQHLEASQKK